LDHATNACRDRAQQPSNKRASTSAMHIPDGFIDTTTAAATGAVSLGALAYAVRRTDRDLGERTVPLLGVTGAFVFAAQMLNFPVAAGTSGHLLGAMLAAVLLGPWAAVIVMSVVLVVQALAMADGGITALGANILNVAIVGSLTGYAVFRLVGKIAPRSRSGYMVAIAVGSWISVMAGAIAAAFELSFSGTIPIRFSLPAMASVHMVIGMGEAIITTTVIGTVLASRPDLIKNLPQHLRNSTNARRPSFNRSWWRRWGIIPVVLTISLALATIVAPFASRAPDGLEKVAVEQGFAAAAGEPVWNLSPFSNYTFPGLGEGTLATAAAGAAGTILLFSVVILLSRRVGRPRPETTPKEDHPESIHPLEGHEHTNHRHAGHSHQTHNHLAAGQRSAEKSEEKT